MATFSAVRALGALRKSVLTSRLSNVRLISTSKKNRETATVAEPMVKEEVESHSVPQKKNWVSYGFDPFSETDDKQAMHGIFFASVTFCIVIGGFVWAYLPDYHDRDWAQREAFLELRRRESLGLPLIDPNYVPIDSIQLPSDEELGETEIII